MAIRASINEELASVVVAEESLDSPSVPWYVTLRPVLFCVLFLFLAEGATRLCFDTTLCLHKERFDNFPAGPMQDVYVDQMKRDKAYKVVIIGDSVVVGPSLLEKDQTIPQYLEKSLKESIPGHEIHVWNYSLAGTRSTDQLLLLQKAIDAHPDLVVITGNYITFANGIEETPIFHPWLAYNLPEIPSPLKSLLPERTFKENAEQKINDFFEKNIRLIGMRQAVNAAFFGVQPRVPFDNPNPAVMIGVSIGKRLHKLDMQPWSKRASSPSIYTKVYNRNIQADAFNGQYYKYIWQTLDSHKIAAFTYITPQNPSVVERAMSPAVYEQNRDVIHSFFNDPNIPFKDYSDLVPNELFYDNDHMLAGGNKMVAEHLSAELTPIISARTGWKSQPSSTRLRMAVRSINDRKQQ